MEENAVEKEKSKFKQAMWSKVNTWLQDLDDPTKIKEEKAINKEDEESKTYKGKPNDDPWPDMNI